MAWGIIMAVPTALGMLMLIFARSGEKKYQTFGATVVNAPMSVVGKTALFP
jgi:hypothetical protein